MASFENVIIDFNKKKSIIQPKLNDEQNNYYIKNKFNIPVYKLILDLDDEIWKEIDTEHNFYISNKGRIKQNIKDNEWKLLNLYRYTGYIIAFIHRKIYYLHRLIAENFIIDKPVNYKELEVDHIDGNKSNNNVDNLRFCTHYENMQNENTKYNNLTNLRKALSKYRKPVAQYDLDDNLIKVYSGIREAAKETNIPSSNIANCVNKKECIDKKGYKYIVRTAGGYNWKYYYGKF